MLVVLHAQVLLQCYLKICIFLGANILSLNERRRFCVCIIILIQSFANFIDYEIFIYQTNYRSQVTCYICCIKAMSSSKFANVRFENNEYMPEYHTAKVASITEMVFRFTLSVRFVI